ncbi:MAG TPA: efflux RND transporter periplasmic adaptor subunit [Longimicrobiaceae bacterium]
MNTRRQLLVSAAIVGVALGTVGLYAAIASPEAAPDQPEGHDHAAMAAAGGEEARSLRLDADAARRIGVTYATATLKPLRREVRTIGSVTYDETRLVNFNPRIEGWIERLHVDFTGAPVRAGEPLMDVYSPMLVSAQEELILARRLVDEARAGGSERALSNAGELLEAARRRLLQWDIATAEIARIEESGTPRRTLTLRAPASGIVVEKSAIEGSRIMPGMDLFRIADLSRVWIDGEVFEKDLSLVRIGQHADVTFEAYPGEVFDAMISYVHPTVSIESRTGRVRLELDNPGLRLKPGMYAQVALHSEGERQALVVPRAAVHYTGTRSLVFVRHGETLMPHEVTTGHVAGAEVEILSGIDPGMQVVSSANFLIDAESNMGSSLSTMPGIDMDGPAGAAPATDPANATPHAGH